jgi:hypothetical protein
MDDLNVTETGEEGLETFTKLSPEDHAFLNSVSLDESERKLPVLERRARCSEIRLERVASMRLKYACAPLALEYIDIYDPRSQYSELSYEYVRAEKAGNIALADQIQRQIDEKYPLLCAEKKNNS